MEYPATMSTDTDSTERADSPEADGVRSLAPAAEYAEGTPDLPKIQLPCFGCGRREVLKYPYADDPNCMWCTVCGTMHHKDTDEKITASIPVLPATILEIYGSKPAIERIQDHLAEKKAEGT